MPGRRVDDAAVEQARALIDDGNVDVDTEWSDAAPSADGGTAVTGEHGDAGCGA